MSLKRLFTRAILFFVCTQSAKAFETSLIDGIQHVLGQFGAMDLGQPSSVLAPVVNEFSHMSTYAAEAANVARTSIDKLIDSTSVFVSSVELNTLLDKGLETAITLKENIMSKATDPLNLVNSAADEISRQVATVNNLKSEFITKLSEVPQLAEILQDKSNVIMKQSYSTFGQLQSQLLSKVPSITSDDIKSIIQAKVNDVVNTATLQVQDFVDHSDPRLKLTTSEYITRVVHEDIQPRLASTLDFLNRSPLAQNTRAFLTQPASVATNEILTVTSDKLSPITNVLNQIVTRVGTRISSPIVDIVNSLENNVQVLTASIPSNQPIADLNIDMMLRDITSDSTNVLSIIPPAKIFNEQLMTSLDTLKTNAVDTFSNTVFPSLVRAGTRFTAELQNTGVRLNENVVAMSQSTGSSFDRLITRLISIPDTSTITTTTTTMPTSSLVDMKSSVYDPTQYQYINRLMSQVTGVTTAISKYQLFTDPTHWETGFWEQQITKLYQLKDLKIEDLQLAQQSVKETLSVAGDRFIARSSKAIETYEQIQSSVQLLQQKYSHFQDNVLATLKTTSNTYNINNIEKEINSIVNDIQTETNTLLTAFQYPMTSSLFNLKMNSLPLNSLFNTLADHTQSIQHQLSIYTDKLPSQTTTVWSTLQSAGKSLWQDLSQYSKTLLNEGDLSY